MSDIDDIRSALSYIDSQDRDTWWQVGAAVKDELGENGYTFGTNGLNVPIVILPVMLNRPGKA